MLHGDVSNVELKIDPWNIYHLAALNELPVRVPLSIRIFDKKRLRFETVLNMIFKHHREIEIRKWGAVRKVEKYRINM